MGFSCVYCGCFVGIRGDVSLTLALTFGWIIIIFLGFKFQLTILFPVIVFSYFGNMV